MGNTTAGLLKNLVFAILMICMNPDRRLLVKIGELLIMNKLITQEQLTQALHQQANSSQKLGEILVEQGIISELQLAEALEFQLGIPVIHLNETVFDEETVRIIDEDLALRWSVMPVEQRAGKLRLAMLDPLHKEAIREIQSATGMMVQPLIAVRSDLTKMHNLHYGGQEHDQKLQNIVSQCLQEKSNEIHFEAYESGMTIKYRIEGVLKTTEVIPPDKQKGFVNRIKKNAGINTIDSRLPQNGRVIKSIGDDSYDIKVSTLPMFNGERLFLRLTKRNEEILKLSELGFVDEHIEVLESVIHRRRGLILFSGENESDNSKTLNSLVKHILKEELQISTIEDAIEHTIDGVSQVEVNEPIGFTFSHGLRAVLRQNPDVVMVGDIKDADTAQLAVKASLSQCLLIGGIRCTHPVKAIRHLEESGLDSSVISSSLSCIVQQRFVRKVCTQCAQNVPMTDQETEIYGKYELLHIDNQSSANKTMLGNFRTLVSAHFNGKNTVIRGSGCRLCNQTGYRGYIGVYEVLPVDETINKFILQKSNLNEYEDYLKQKGHKSLLYDGLVKARNGKTTLEEVLKGS
jgi:type IV pilus assembly protein PilB